MALLRGASRDGLAGAEPGEELVKVGGVERHGGPGNVGLGFLRGLGLQSGALAASVARDSHNIVVAGISDDDMRRAVEEVEHMQGGLVVAKVICSGRIQDDCPKFALSAIDVSNAEGGVEPKESEIDLIYGARIFEWGRSPHASGSQVLPISKKLENLRQVLSDPRFEHVRVVSLFTSPLVGS